MQGNPDTRQQQGDGHIQKPHRRIVGAGADPYLFQQPIATLDAEASAVQLAHVPQRLVGQVEQDIDQPDDVAGAIAAFAKGFTTQGRRSTRHTRHFTKVCVVR